MPSLQVPFFNKEVLQPHGGERGAGGAGRGWAGARRLARELGRHWGARRLPQASSAGISAAAKSRKRRKAKGAPRRTGMTA